MAMEYNFTALCELPLKLFGTILYKFIHLSIIDLPFKQLWEYWKGFLMSRGIARAEAHPNPISYVILLETTLDKFSEYAI